MSQNGIEVKMEKNERGYMSSVYYCTYGTATTRTTNLKFARSWIRARRRETKKETK